MKPQVWLVLLGWALPSLGITVLELEQQIQELKKTLQQEYTEKINTHYEKALAPLKQQEETEKKAAITHLEYFLEHDFKSPQRPDALLSVANLYFDLDLPKSIHWLKLFILQYPESKHLDAAYYMLGIAYLYESHLEETEQTFQYFLKNFKESAYAEEIRFRLAELYFEQNNYPAAASSLEPILENSKNRFYSKALYKYAWIAYLENNYSKAIEEFSRLLELDSGSNEILDKEATRYIAKSLLENSKNPTEELGSQKWARSVLIQLGDLYIKADKTQAAAHAFEKAVALDPKNPNNRELDFKIFALTPSIEIQKNLVAQYLDKSILLDLAVKLHKEKLYREAAGYYALFINQFPEADDLEQVIFYYAEACFDATQYAYAATGFEQVRDWPHPTEYRERAALNAVYAHAQAIKQAFPDYDLSAIHLANKGLMQGPIPEAMLGYIQATDILAADFKTLPEIPSLLFQAAGIYWDYGETERAVTLLENIEKNYPDKSTAQTATKLLLGHSFERANLLFSQGAYSKAAEIYLELLQKDPHSKLADKIIFNAAMALDRSNQHSEAEYYYAVLEKNHPNSPLAKTATEWRASYFEQNYEFERAGSVYLKIKHDPKALLKAALNFQAVGEFSRAGELFERFVREYPKAPEVQSAYLQAAKAYQAGHKPKDEKRILAEFAKRYKTQNAQAAYLSLNDAFQYYKTMSLNSSLSKRQGNQLNYKTEELMRLQKAYEKIIKTYSLSPWTLASIYNIGSMYENLSQSILKAPCPEDVAKIDDSACDEYASLLEDKVFVLEKKAIDAYQLLINKSVQVINGSSWSLKAKAALYRMKPSDYMPAELLLNGPTVNKTLLEPIKTAQEFYFKKNYDAAQIVLEDLIEKNPKLTVAYLWLGHTYEAQREIALAITAYEKAGAFGNLGLLYLDQGNLEQAYLNLQKSGNSLYLGNYYFAAGEPNKALEAYTQALVKDSQGSDVYFNLGFLALSQKDYAKAKQDLETYLQKGQPSVELQARIKTYLKSIDQKLQLEQQRHETNS